jgi:hypothetical protein
MIKLKEKDVFHIKYDSLNDFFKNTNVNEPFADIHSGNRSEYNDIKNDAKGSHSWRFGDENTQKEFHTVRFDPAKGKIMCAEDVKKTIKDKSYKNLIRQAMTYRKRVKYEDVGFRLNVPKAIAGEDRYFSVYKNSKKPVVKIAINICGSACVDNESFVRVAKTAIPTIYALETAGIATEVYYCAFSTRTHSNFAATAVHVKIKSAEQRFNWTTFAPVFTLGSYRESIFLAWLFTDEKVNGGLGCPMDSSTIKQHDNFGYTSVIGLNTVGPVETVSEIFEKLKK